MIGQVRAGGDQAGWVSGQPGAKGTVLAELGKQGADLERFSPCSFGSFLRPSPPSAEEISGNRDSEGSERRRRPTYTHKGW